MAHKKEEPKPTAKPGEEKSAGEAMKDAAVNAGKVRAAGRGVNGEAQAGGNLRALCGGLAVGSWCCLHQMCIPPLASPRIASPRIAQAIEHGATVVKDDAVWAAEKTGEVSDGSCLAGVLILW